MVDLLGPDGYLKDLLEGMEKNLIALAKDCPNHDQRSAFMYSSGVIRQKLRDLGLDTEVAEARAKMQVAALESAVIRRKVA